MSQAGTVKTKISTGTNRIRIAEVPVEVAQDELVRTSQTLGNPVTALRGATGLILTETETAGGFNLAIATHVFVAQGEVTDNETEVSVCHAQVVLPPDYIAGTDITVTLPVALVADGSPTNNGSTIDLSVYRQEQGAVGSDLCATSAKTFAALDTWYDKAFTVTGTTL